MKLRAEADKLYNYLAGLVTYQFRHTTYSRHFTKTRVLLNIASVLKPHLKPETDTYVDFSAGNNEFPPMLGLRYVSYDILPHPLGERAREAELCLDKDGEGIAYMQKQNWLAVDAGSLPPGELVVGLNPPFGKANTAARAFIEHAAECGRARIIVLIVPNTIGSCDETPYAWDPPGYKMIHFDSESVDPSKHAFYVPGAAGYKGSIAAKNVRPRIIIYERIGPAGERVCGCKHNHGARAKALRQSHQKLLAWEGRSKAWPSAVPTARSD
eukprot:CAMPEP_0119431994 /NCGR_PEP_ID=MMETSP1335-20130426/46986_1 /TAXON_ID=259385 /ORGANISM="Chrysoculter rhomboideus, Strain RCC1486" /LENGTH=268 /DNA_ID=CAMNT_0007457805 /DNA_START=114 /DNA_END=920 /DNA_ORIENTATION=-